MHGEKQQASFCTTSNTTCGTGNSTKATMLNSIHGRLGLLLVRANARAFITRSISEATTMDLLEG